MKTHWKKPLLWNLALLVLFFMLGYFLQDPGPSFPDLFGFTSIFMILLAPVNLLIGMVKNRNKKPDGPVYLVMAGLLFLIGFSVCTGVGLNVH